MVMARVETGAATVMLSDLVAVVPRLSVTLTVKAEVPAAVGVPLMAPAPERVRPAGRVPLLMLQL